MLEGIFWSFLASLVTRGLMKQWIATLVGAAIFGASRGAPSI